jgi:hypothetical protein
MTSDQLGSRIAVAPTPGGGCSARRPTPSAWLAVRPGDGLAPVPAPPVIYWGGYAGTDWVDPKGSWSRSSWCSRRAPCVYHRTLFRQLVYQAIVD